MRLTRQPEIFNNLGNAYSKLNQHREAIETWQKILEITPENSEVYFKLGSAYGKLDDLQQAIECWEKCISINPNDIEAYFNLGSDHICLSMILLCGDAYCNKRGEHPTTTAVGCLALSAKQ